MFLVRRAPQWAWSVVLLAAAVAARADDAKPKDPPAKEEPPKSAAEQYQALVKEFQTAQEEFFKVYRTAKTDEERQKFVDEKYPKPQEFAKKFADLAKKYPTDPAAVDALVWVSTSAAGTAESKEALATLLKEHVTSDKLGRVCSALVYDADGERTLRRIATENPHADVQGQAQYALGQALKSRGDRGDEAAGKEAERQFELVAAKYADVKMYNTTLGKLASGELREIRLLAVGKPAPDISGEDIDGKPFKLSDYRGKVVLLDFWGHW